jgi:hypothetical protein
MLVGAAAVAAVVLDCLKYSDVKIEIYYEYRRFLAIIDWSYYFIYYLFFIMI